MRVLVTRADTYNILMSGMQIENNLLIHTYVDTVAKLNQSSVGKE